MEIFRQIKDKFFPQREDRSAQYRAEELDYARERIIGKTAYFNQILRVWCIIKIGLSQQHKLSSACRKCKP